MSINRLSSNNNTFELAKVKAASKKQVPEGGVSGKGKVPGGNKAPETDCFKPTQALEGKIGAVSSISLVPDTAPLPKTEHTDALKKASSKLSPEQRMDQACQLIAQKLGEEFFRDVA